MEWIDAIEADGEAVGVSWRPTGIYRSGTIRLGQVVSPDREIGFFWVPRTLLDGTLPNPRRWGEPGEWISEYDFDFLVFAYSNGKAESYSGEDAMKERCGIGSYDYWQLGPDTVREIRTGVWDRLCEAGLARRSGRLALQRYPIYELLVPPQVSRHGLKPTGVVATQGNLEEVGEPYVMMPRVIMTKMIWKQVRFHWLRRLLCAIYVFNDLAAYGGVDIEAIRMEDGRIGLSDLFLRAVGETDTVKVVRGLDFLAHHCGLANWLPVRTAVASTRPGERRLVYLGDAEESPVSVFRPTLQTKAAYEAWLSRSPMEAGEGA